jgi:uncharacterized protein
LIVLRRFIEASGRFEHPSVQGSALAFTNSSDCRAVRVPIRTAHVLASVGGNRLTIWSRPVPRRIPAEVPLVALDGNVVCERCVVADNSLARMRGLLGRSELAPEEGIFLQPASSVHTWFMRFPIDVVFLDRDLSVLRVVRRLAPWRTAHRRRATAVLELAAGESERRGIEVGQRLSWAEGS